MYKFTIGEKVICTKPSVLKEFARFTTITPDTIFTVAQTYAGGLIASFEGLPLSYKFYLPHFEQVADNTDIIEDCLGYEMPDVIKEDSFWGYDIPEVDDKERERYLSEGLTTVDEYSKNPDVTAELSYDLDDAFEESYLQQVLERTKLADEEIDRRLSVIGKINKEGDKMFDNLLLEDEYEEDELVGYALEGLHEDKATVGKASASQVAGNHYTSMGISPLEITYELYGYEGVKASLHTKVNKYVGRNKHNELEDLKKAKHCIELLIEFKEREAKSLDKS